MVIYSVIDLCFFFHNFLQLIDQHHEVLGKAKSEYEQVKKIVNELRASEVTELIQ